MEAGRPRRRAEFVLQESLFVSNQHYLCNLQMSLENRGAPQVGTVGSRNAIYIGKPVATGELQGNRSRQSRDGEQGGEQGSR